MIKSWLQNKENCKEIVNKNPRLISKKETKGGFSGDYLTWTIVYKWMIKHFDFIFEVQDIKTSTDGSNGYVKAKLTLMSEINEQGEKENIYFSQTLALSLETFKRQNGDYYQESPEALQMRVFVKLVANLTGFGFHLWEK